MNRASPSIKLIVLLALAALSSSRAFAQDPEQDELSQLLNLLDQQTSLATNTRLNVDFVPGMISVLSHETMLRHGYRTVWEALASLPGVLAIMDETGMRSLSVRGIGELFEPSKIKLLLNGSALNASASATTGTLYDTPVQQVERIEFIRGPGSAIHGEFAYAGVLNVITRKRGDEYALAIAADDGYGFSGLFDFSEPGRDYELSFSLAANQSNGEDISSGTDKSPIGIPSYAPGPINNKRDFISAIVDFNSGSINAALQFQQANRGDYFGSANLLPADQKQTVISDTVFSATLGQAIAINDKLGANWLIEGVHNSTEKNSLFLGVAENFGGLGTEDDIIADSLLEEQRLEARVNLQYDAAEHQLFAELVRTRISVSESELFVNRDPVTGLPAPTLNEFSGPVDKSLTRDSTSLVLQDEYAIDDSLTLTSGLRFDNYQDMGSNLSPRIALVWRKSAAHIFKTQLARAFRPPSLIEFGGALGNSIEAEINDTFELGHIYQANDLVLRNTFYLSQLQDLIVFQDVAPFGYKNSARQNLRGYELELEKSIANQWDINASLSLQDYAGAGLLGAAPWMIKLGVGYTLQPLSTLHLEISSISRRDRDALDTRGDFPQTTQADLSLQTRNLRAITGLNLRLGIRNILGDELKYPAVADTYAADYPYSDGALLWLQISYRP